MLEVFVRYKDLVLGSMWLFAGWSVAVLQCTYVSVCSSSSRLNQLALVYEFQLAMGDEIKLLFYLSLQETLTFDHTIQMHCDRTGEESKDKYLVHSMCSVCLSVGLR